MQSFCTITIKGEEIGLKFGLFAMRLIVENIDTTQVGNTYSEMDYAHMLHAGYKNNILVKEIPEKLSFEDFVDYVEECAIYKKFEDIVKAYTTFAESRVVTSIRDKKKEAQNPAVKTKRNSRK